MSKKSTQQQPSKVSVQVIRELFEDAKNKKAITATVYLEFDEVWEHFYANKGNKEIKAVDSKKLRSLYAKHTYKK
jgi:predicted nucleic acid-binding protein